MHVDQRSDILIDSTCTLHMVSSIGTYVPDRRTRLFCRFPQHQCSLGYPLVEDKHNNSIIHALNQINSAIDHTDYVTYNHGYVIYMIYDSATLTWIDAMLCTQLLPEFHTNCA